MYYRLYRYLQVNKVLYKYQFGFRKNYSTSLALIDVIDNIYSNINDKFCGGVYLDLQKAFDTVNHDILLYECDKYGPAGLNATVSGASFKIHYLSHITYRIKRIKISFVS